MFVVHLHFPHTSKICSIVTTFLVFTRPYLSIFFSKTLNLCAKTIDLLLILIDINSYVQSYDWKLKIVYLCKLFLKGTGKFCKPDTFALPLLVKTEINICCLRKMVWYQLRLEHWTDWPTWVCEASLRLVLCPAFGCYPMADRFQLTGKYFQESGGFRFPHQHEIELTNYDFN